MCSGLKQIKKAHSQRNCLLANFSNIITLKCFVVVSIFLISVKYIYAIEPILVKFKCNLRTINKQEGDNRKEWTLKENTCGWCHILKSKHPNEQVGHEGLLIYRAPYDMGIKVYDLMCPECDKKGTTSQIRMDSSVDARCEKCGIRYDVCNVGSSMISASMEWLEGYPFRIVEDSIFIDNSPGLEQRRRLWKNNK